MGLPDIHPAAKVNEGRMTMRALFDMIGYSIYTVDEYSIFNMKAFYCMYDVLIAIRYAIVNGL